MFNWWTIPSKPKFYLLNFLRFFSLLGLLFVFITNLLVLVEDIKAVKAPIDKDHEDCDYLENSGVPNQPAGEFRAFLSIALNLIQCIVFIIAELNCNLLKPVFPCLATDGLVAVGTLEVLLAVQVMSHFLDNFGVVACFFLFVAGLMNMFTMPMDHPKSYRSIAAWKNIRMGRAPSVSVGRDVHSVMTEKGFGRNGSNQSHTSSPLLPAPAVLSRKTTGSNNEGNPPTYYRPPSFGYSSYEK